MFPNTGEVTLPTITNPNIKIISSASEELKEIFGRFDSIWEDESRSTRDKLLHTLNLLKKNLSSSFSQLNTIEATKDIIEILFALDAYHSLYLEKGIKDEQLSIESYLGQHINKLEPYFAAQNEQLALFSLDMLYLLYDGTQQILLNQSELVKNSTLTDYLKSLLTSYLESLEIQIKKKQRTQISQLFDCINKQQFASFLNLYKRIDKFRFLKQEDSALIPHLVALTLEKIQEIINNVSLYSTKPFETMSQDELATYFKQIAELEHFQPILSVFAGADYNFKVATIHKQLENYQRQVSEFSAFIKKNKRDLQKLYENIKVYRALTLSLDNNEYIDMEEDELGEEKVITENIQQILAKYKSFTPTSHSVPAVHKDLLQLCVNAYAALFIEQIQLAVKKYDSIPVDTYSEDLPTLFSFIDSIKDDYPQVYKAFKDKLIFNISLFIQASPDNYGWDVIERYSVLEKKRSCIPQEIWEECNITSLYQDIREMMTREHHALEAQTLSIRQLAERLFKLSNETYGLGVRDQLTSSIQTKIEQIRALKENQFEQAVKELNNIWIDLQFFSTINKLIDKRWKCHIKGLKNFYSEVIREIVKHFEERSVGFATALSIDSIDNISSTIELFLILYTTYTTSSEGRNDSLFAAVFPESSMLAQKYLTHLQGIMDFYQSLNQNFNDYLAANQFAEVLLILKVLRERAVWGKFFNIVSAYADHLPDIQIRRIRNEFEAADLTNQIVSKYQELSANALLSIHEDLRFTSASNEDKREVQRLVFAAYEGLQNYYSSEIYLAVNQTEGAIQELLAKAKLNIQKNLDFIQQMALEALPEELFTLDSNAYRAFNVAYENLTIAQEVCTNPEILLLIKARVEFFKQNIAENLNKYVDNILATPDISLEQIILNLIKLKKMSLFIGQFKAQITDAIERLLKAIVRTHFSHVDILSLSEALKNQKDYDAEANMLLTEHEVFTSFVIALRNKKVLHQDIDYVCAQLAQNAQNSSLDIARLKTLYTQFQEEYWAYVQKGLEGQSSELVPDIYTEIFNEILAESTEDSLSDYPTKVIKLAACFFAYWSAQDYKKRAEEKLAGGAPSANATITLELDEAFKLGILQPHPAQIIGIFRLFGIDQDPSDNLNVTDILSESLKYLKNHLAEIHTGEGKSLVMAVTAMILAAMGYKVDCACYSQYLTQRDFQRFAQMFRTFNLHENISYATFKEFIEQWINTEYGKNLRDQVDKLSRGIRGKQLPLLKPENEKPHILFMDELDIFFSEEFSGSSYPISHVFASREIFHLIRFIWTASQNRILTLSLIQNDPLSGYYRILQSLVSGFNKILDNAILAMLEDIKIYKDKKGDFVLDTETGRIGYKPPHDHIIEYNVTYRYQTIFAYIEHLAETNLSKKIGLLLNCGEFSYAEMLKRYKYVLGVTGTLSTLGRTAKSQLDDLLQVSQFTYIPSVYGDNRIDFPNTSSIKCVRNEDYFATLTSEIASYREEKTTEGENTLRRPVMIFFKSTNELMAYYTFLRENKPFDEQTLDNIIILDEKVSDTDRDNYISRATFAGSILLATSSYTRGVDFICNSQQVNDIGGPHLIGGFFPEDKSAETQFLGRTKRQGGNGSASMVLNFNDVEEEYHSFISEEDKMGLQKATDGVTLYSILDALRARKLEEQHSKYYDRMEEIRVVHIASIQLVEALHNSEESATDAELLHSLSTFNQFKTVITRSAHKETKAFNTICLIDATYSMFHTLEAVKNSVHKMYTRAQTIFDEAETQLPIKPVINIQFVFYRNYNSPYNEIMQCSPWYNPQNYHLAQQFLSRIQPKNGWVNEAAEVAFAYVNRHLVVRNDVDQIIWIGDTSPNSPEEITEKRKKLTHPIREPFIEPVEFVSERQKIIEARIPIHAFLTYTKHTSENAEKIYQETAQLSGGVYGTLNTNTKQGAENLAHAITKRILDKIGGSDLVRAYEAKYQATYISSSTAGQHSLFHQSSQTLASVSSSGTLISREEMRQELLNYLNIKEVRNGGLFHHRKGRNATNELLTKIDDPRVTDETLREEFEKWGQKGKLRSRHTESYSVFTMSHSKTSQDSV